MIGWQAIDNQLETGIDIVFQNCDATGAGLAALEALGEAPAEWNITT